MKLNLPTSLTRFAGNQSLMLQKNSPAILFAVGITGFVATTVLASRATLKLNDVMDEFEGVKEEMRQALDNDDVDYDMQDYNTDRAQLMAVTGIDIFKLYGPAIVCGGISIAALTGSHHILNKRNAGLSAAYAALDKAFTAYRARVRDEYGDDKDREFRHGYGEVQTYEADKDGNLKAKLVKTLAPSGASQYAKFFDELNQNYQPTAEYNQIFLRARQQYANDLLRARGHIFLNEVYDGLGIERTRAGSVVGWSLQKNPDSFVDFGIFDVTKPGSIQFVNGREAAILLDFNVDGTILDDIE